MGGWLVGEVTTRHIKGMKRKREESFESISNKSLQLGLLLWSTELCMHAFSLDQYSSFL